MFIDISDWQIKFSEKNGVIIIDANIKSTKDDNLLITLRVKDKG